MCMSELQTKTPQEQISENQFSKGHEFAVTANEARDTAEQAQLDEKALVAEGAQDGDTKEMITQHQTKAEDYGAIHELYVDEAAKHIGREATRS